MQNPGNPLSHERRLLLAVDAPSLLHRNHHARAESGLHDRGGRPRGPCTGCCARSWRRRPVRADAVLFGLDDRRSSVREEAYPAYKAGRRREGSRARRPAGARRRPARRAGPAHRHPPGLEADDVSASAATWAERSGWNCVIVTSDRDAFAHISDQTQVLRLISGGINGSPLLNPARLHAMYGVAAEHYLEYAALRGDASDNLPGVPGIGEKTAPVLLSQMGSMQAVWADIEHCDGATLVATLDSYCEEQGPAASAPALLKRLAAAGARERFEFNLAMMSGRIDLDLGLTPDVPGSPGLLPLDAGPGRPGRRPPRGPVDDAAGAAGAHRAAGVLVGWGRTWPAPPEFGDPRSYAPRVAVNRSRKARAARRRKRRMDGVVHDLTAEQWAALQAAWGGCAYCGANDGALQRDCVLPDLARRPLHRRQRRAGLPLVQHQQVQRRGHRLAPEEAARRAGLPAAPPRAPGAALAPASRRIRATAVWPRASACANAVVPSPSAMAGRHRRPGGCARSAGTAATRRPG